MADLLDELRNLITESIAEESEDDAGITLLMLDEMIAIKRAEQNGNIYEPGFDIAKQGGADYAHMLAPYPLLDLEVVCSELNANPK